MAWTCLAFQRTTFLTLESCQNVPQRKIVHSERQCKSRQKDLLLFHCFFQFFLFFFFSHLRYGPRRILIMTTTALLFLSPSCELYNQPMNAKDLVNCFPYRTHFRLIQECFNTKYKNGEGGGSPIGTGLRIRRSSQNFHRWVRFGIHFELGFTSVDKPKYSCNDGV